MSDFDYSPALPVRKASRPATKSVELGDGYEQRAADGINTLKGIYPLSFNGRDDTEADAIITFLEGRNGTIKFTWTPPGESEIKVICKEWNRTRLGNLNNITTVFKQVFET